MSHTVDTTHSHKTCGIAAFLLRSPSTWASPSLTHSPIKYGSVGEEKELGNEVLPDLDTQSSNA